MVETQIAGRGISDGRILSAFLSVPRHLFVEKEDMFSAYADRPLPIGLGQTISQPYIVAEMCALAQLRGDERILEIGTGSGYAAAILSFLSEEVCTIERIHSLHRQAAKVLEKLGYRNVTCILGDGYHGYAKRAPYDAILISAAPERIPDTLVLQLKQGGRIISPVGKGDQYLVRLVRTPAGVKRSIHGAVRFVPMKHGFS